MKTTLQSLQESISKAVDMIDESQLISEELLEIRLTKQATNSLDFTNANTLLDKCDRVTSRYNNAKPVMRVIHHFSCSGGTLVSKCIAAMPNVFLLSEVHPDTDFHLKNSNPRFSPSDVFALARYADVPMTKKLSKKLFLGSIKTTSEHVESFGGQLVLREHTHSDYLLGTKESDESALINALSEYYEINSVLTIRHPLDAYAALIKNDWVQFEPNTFDEFCRRFLTFIERYDKNKIFKFEDLISHPKLQMIDMCNVLDIPYTDSFEDIFDMFKVTGNSGRTGGSIEKRDRIAPQELVNQCRQSKYFAKICDAGWYEMPVDEEKKTEVGSSK